MNTLFFVMSLIFPVFAGISVFVGVCFLVGHVLMMFNKAIGRGDYLPVYVSLMFLAFVLSAIGRFGYLYTKNISESSRQPTPVAVESE